MASSFLLLLLLFHLIEAGGLSNWTECLRLAKVVVSWVVLQVHPLSLKTVAIELASCCLRFVCFEDLSSAVRLTSTLSMLPVLLLSKDKSSSGGTPGSKKSCPNSLSSYQLFINTHPFWTIFPKLKEVLIFLGESLIDVLQHWDNMEMDLYVISTSLCSP